jgi:hypothetical protein
MTTAIAAVAVITASSGIVVAVRMSETHPGRRRPVAAPPTEPA